jgi:hypothetical protein
MRPLISSAEKGGMIPGAQVYICDENHSVRGVLLPHGQNQAQRTL